MDVYNGGSSAENGVKLEKDDLELGDEPAKDEEFKNNCSSIDESSSSNFKGFWKQNSDEEESLVRKLVEEIEEPMIKL